MYLERFTTYGDQTLFAPEIATSTKTLGELKTFECPQRTPDDSVALAKTLVVTAEGLGAEDDWGGAAALYAQAYQLDPNNHGLAFDVAVASWNSRECADALPYFDHFMAVADPREYRSKLREAKRYKEEASMSMCPTWAPGEKETHARDLYAQAQSLDLALDFKAAIDKYERAYYVLPDNHALTYRIADSAWKAQLCDKASENYRIFVSKVDPADPRYTTDLPIANGIIARVDASGCPNALWSGGGGGAAGAAPVAAAGGAGGAGDENPPASAKAKASGGMACAIGDEAPAGGLGFSILLLAGLLGQRRRQRQVS